MPRKDLHRGLLIEGSTYVFVRDTCRLHLCPALRVLHSTFHKAIDFLFGEFYKRKCLILFQIIFFCKSFLEVFHMLLYRLFSSSLHTRVYSGVYLKSIGINVIFRPIGFWVVFNPLFHEIA